MPVLPRNGSSVAGASPSQPIGTNRGTRANERGGQGSAMTAESMDFGGPMSSKEAHWNFGEDLFFFRLPSFDRKNS